MALTSSSTFAEVETERFATDGYRITRSASEALRYARACRRLMQLLPSNSTKGANSVSYDPGLLESEAERAEAYADTLDTSPPTRKNNIVHADLRGMRRRG